MEEQITIAPGPAGSLFIKKVAPTIGLMCHPRPRVLKAHHHGGANRADVSFISSKTQSPDAASHGPRMIGGRHEPSPCLPYLVGCTPPPKSHVLNLTSACIAAILFISAASTRLPVEQSLRPETFPFGWPCSLKCKHRIKVRSFSRAATRRGRYEALFRRWKPFSVVRRRNEKLMLNSPSWCMCNRVYYPAVIRQGDGFYRYILILSPSVAPPRNHESTPPVVVVGPPPSFSPFFQKKENKKERQRRGSCLYVPHQGLLVNLDTVMEVGVHRQRRS